MSRPSSLVALVTGANRGIGLEVVRQLAQKGIHVILSARNPEKGEAAVKKLLLEGLSVEFWQLDITDEASVRACAEWVRKTHGGLDILVNNAGVLLDPSRNPPDAVGASIFNSKLSTIRGSIHDRFAAFGFRAFDCLVAKNADFSRQSWHHGSRGIEARLVADVVL